MNKKQLSQSQYWLFAFPGNYPSGGLNDYVFGFNDIKEFNDKFEHYINKVTGTFGGDPNLFQVLDRACCEVISTTKYNIKDTVFVLLSQKKSLIEILNDFKKTPAKKENGRLVYWFSVPATEVSKQVLYNAGISPEELSKYIEKDKICLLDLGVAKGFTLVGGKFVEILRTEG
ncbi:hypothetical protein D3C71_1134020 [compost metagenome]